MLNLLGQVFVYVVPFLLVLTVVVTIHELGHFLVARAFKVKVDRFSIGFGRTLLSRTDRHGIEWRLAWLPLLFAGLGVSVVPARIAEVQPGTAAAQAGFQVEDRVIEADGRTIADYRDVGQVVALRAGTPIEFVVLRDGRRVSLTATPVRTLRQDPISGPVRVGYLGVGWDPRPGEVVYIRYPPHEALGQAVKQTGDILGTTLTYLGRIATGKESGDLLSGPLGIAKAASGVTKQAAAATTDVGLQVANVALMLVQFAAIVSIGIGFLNLLPIPVLDGGHLLFYGYEAVARRPVPANVQEVGYRVGLALLVGLMLFATWNDLQKLSLFKFLGGLAS